MPAAGESLEGSPQALTRLLADVPISIPEQDRMGRTPFAEMLAHSVLNVPGEHGFVFALYGAWGCGKTSIINLVEHYLQSPALPDPKPILVRFNPWWFSGQDQLLLQFFEQMRLALGRKDMPEALRQLAGSLRALGKLLALATYVPPAASVAQVGKRVVETAGDLADAAVEQFDQDVWAAHSRICEALAGQERRVVIMIDDIDRLPADEIRLMFRVIKAIADFPKTVYLLAFDQRVVAHALNADHVSGDAFLEKVVQAPFNVPPPDRYAVHQMLSEQLDLLLRDTPAELRDRDRWSAVFREGIDHLIQSPRHVKRYVNALAPTYAAVAREVNAVDFLAIEALRVFVPELYTHVRANEDLFVETGGLSLESLQLRLFAEHRADRHKACLDLAPEPLRNPASALLSYLFPAYARAAGGSGLACDLEERWRSSTRICNPTFFPVYFRFGLPEGMLSNAHVRQILSLASEPVVLARELARLSQVRPPRRPTSRLAEFLDRLEIGADQLPELQMSPVIHALFHAGDTLLCVDDSRGFWQETNYGCFRRILGKLLARLARAERHQLLCEAITCSRSVAIAVRFVGVLANEHGEDGPGAPGIPEPSRTVDAGQLAQLQQLAVQRIEQAAAEGTLPSCPDLAYLLFRWGAWGREDRATGFVAQLTESDEGFADFVAGFLLSGYAPGSADPTDSVQWHIDVEKVARLADTTGFSERAQRILATAPPWLDARRRLGLEVFVRETHTASGPSTASRPHD